MARPRKEIDWEVVRKLCAMQCTGEETASFIDVNYDTLNAATKREHNMGFSDYFKKQSANGKISLRRKQYEVAMSGNVPMLIWLGKQYLDQKDKQSNEHTGAGGGAIKTENTQVPSMPILTPEELAEMTPQELSRLVMTGKK